MAKDLDEVYNASKGIAELVIIRNKIDSVLKLSEAMRITLRHVQDDKVKNFLDRIHEFCKSEELVGLVEMCDKVEKSLRIQRESNLELHGKIARLVEDMEKITNFGFGAEVQEDKTETVSDEDWGRKQLITKTLF